MRARPAGRTGFRSRAQARRRRPRRWRETSAGRFAPRRSWRLHPAYALAGGDVNGGADALVAAATANIGDGGVDLLFARARLVLEQRGHRHDHAALAIAALRDIEIEPRLLHGMQDAVRLQAFDGGDPPVGDRAHRQRTGPYRPAVDVHG